MRCENCGYVNPNNMDTCLKCGNKMQTLVNSDTQSIGKSQQLNHNEDNSQHNSTQNNINQQNNYQPNFNPQINKSKNMILAIILSFLFTGIGNVYLGLVKRGLVEFVIGLILIMLGANVSSIFMVINFIWWIYVIYDTYVCTKAINDGTVIPKLVNYIEIE